MQGKGISLRLGLLALVVVLVLSAVGSLSLARDAFDDNEFEDCPAATRMSAVSGLAIDRTDKEDEIRVSWDALTDAELDSLGSNFKFASLTVIVEDGDGEADEPDKGNLGDTWLVVKGISFASEITVSVAITVGDYVISDIAEKDFTSGMPAPAFSTSLREATATGRASTVGYTAGDDHTQSFYYLGFNDTFDNWFVRTPPEAPDEGESPFSTKPATAKFRVGLAHADSVVDPDKADFDHYRIVIEDSSGDLLGYQAQTVSGKRTYGGKVLVFGVYPGGGVEARLDVTDLFTAATTDPAAPAEYDDFTNIRLSNQVTGNSQLSPYYAVVNDCFYCSRWRGYFLW